MFFRQLRESSGLKTQIGASLLELTVILAILGIVASAMMPDISFNNSSKLDLAAQEMADAIRFARSESIRRGVPMGFSQPSAQNRIRVFRMDTATTPWSPVYDVIHPVTKQVYDVKLDSHAFARVDDISPVREYRGTCNRVENVYFDRSGVPRCMNPQNVLLQRYDITLTLDAHTRLVSLAAITGRVSIQ